ncbi:MFS transporter [Rahnella sp. PCH160]|uniref:MFS transporter n=1 Tax=Rahnella sp. PCH160 TaxID=3447928 RepID=UPI0039FC6449
MKNLKHDKLALVSLAVGAFGIGTSEFSSMGVLPLFSVDLSINISDATQAITAYAIGVVVGAPLLTLAAARINRRSLLLVLMLVLAVGNIISSAAYSLETLSIGRFISGLPQGVFFGAGAVVATHIVGQARAGKAFAIVVSGMTLATIIGAPMGTLVGQYFGWRTAYSGFAIYNILALGCMFVWLPKTPALDGNPVSRELTAFLKWKIWAMMIIASLCVASTFSVYTFIGPYITDLANLSPTFIPVGLAVFGLGMAVGNPLGGILADRYEFKGMLLGFAFTLLMLATMALYGQIPLILMLTLFFVGATLMIAVPTIPVRMMHMAPEAPTLMGAMNMAAFNVANALGASIGGATINAGLGLISAIWAGFALTSIGLLFFTVVFGVRRTPVNQLT